MNREDMSRLDDYRLNEAGPLENDLVDELADGAMDREDFIRRATVLGLSMSVIGAALGAYGSSPAFAAPASIAQVGGRLRLGCTPPPEGKLDPHLYVNTGQQVTGSVTGEFLVHATRSLALLPELALSWKPNARATVWTYKLRPGVKFQNGQPFTADDVVATFKRLTDPKSGSQALSAFKGVLSPSGVRKINNLTVQFRLDAPNASFPYLTSSTTYQAIVLPKNYKLGSFEKTPQTTGAFRLVSYTPGVGAKYERNPGWWGGRAALDGVDATYYSEDSAIVSALLGNQIDLINQINVVTGRALLNNPRVQIFPARGASHRQICMRVDAKNELKDARVRRAMALTLDRPAIIKTLFNNLSDLGNDSPFAPVQRATNKSVPQRKKNLAEAKRLMAQAGLSRGFKITITVVKTGELPQLAQILQRSVKAIGIDMRIVVLNATAYYAGSQTGPPLGFGTTPWLNEPMTLTNWGHRSVPDVLITSAFKSKGVWNAAHYSNKKFDAAAKAFAGAIALSDQRKYEKQMQLILLRDTPVILPYFYNYLAAGSTKVKGYQAEAIGNTFLSRSSLA
ncbi:MAG: ABC transporter substrate-binding protein [Gaiellaceae bacterium]